MMLGAWGGGVRTAVHNLMNTTGANRVHLWPPWPAMTMIMAATRSIVHSAALAMPCGS